MIIDIDVGNSAIKWCLRAGSETTYHRSQNDAELVQSIVAAFTDYALSPTSRVKIRVASVRSEQQTNELTKTLFDQLHVTPIVVHSQRESAGVKNSYREPEKMGVDRWCAVLAAVAEADDLSSNANICVVDAGTATTIDFVDTARNHRGGYIIPGLSMQLDSLFSGTDRVRADSEINQASLAPGVNTLDAVHRGILAATVSLIDRSIDNVGADSKANAQESLLFITGGNAEIIAQHLSHQAIVRPHLVLDGICFAQ